MDAILRDVDGGILFGETSKRPLLYSNTVNYLLNNIHLLTSDFIIKTLGEERYFLSLALAETILRKNDVAYRIFKELLDKGSPYIHTLGLNHLTFYKKLKKSIVSLKNTDILKTEESSRYNIYGAEGFDVLKSRQHYLSNLLKTSNDVVEVLSIFLPLASKPSLIKPLETREDIYWATSWPYTIAYNRKKGTIRWLIYGSILKEFNVGKLDIGEGEIDLVLLGNSIAIILKKHLKHTAIVSSITTEPKVITGNVIGYDGLDSLYSIELSGNNAYINKYDEYGNLIYSRIIEIPALGNIKNINYIPTSDGGILFNILTNQGSLIIIIDTSIKTHKFKENIEHIVSLPLGYNIFYTERYIYIAKKFRDELKIKGPYNKPSIKTPLFIGGAFGLGIIAISNEKIYQIDSLGNIIASSNLSLQEGYTHVKIINTYLLPMIVLEKNGKVSAIIVYLDNDFVKLDHKAIGFKEEIINVSYNNGTLCFNTTDGYSYCLSPLYLKWLLQNKVKHAKKYTLKELADLHDKIRATGDIQQIYGIETFFDSQLLEEVIHRDHNIRENLLKAINKEINTSLNRILNKHFRTHTIDDTLNLFLVEYYESIKESSPLIFDKTVHRVLASTNAKEIRLSSIVALARAISELKNIDETFSEKHVVKVMTRFLSVFEELNLPPETIKNILSEFPKEIEKIILKKLVRASSSTSPIINDIAMETLKTLGYDLYSFRNEKLNVEKALANIFVDSSRIKKAFEERYKYLLDNALFDEIKQYLNNSKKLVEYILGLSSKLREYNIDITKNPEFINEVEKCFKSELTDLQWYQFKAQLDSIAECNKELKNILNIVYERIKDSACLNKDLIDNAIRDLKSCREKVKVTENLARKISRLLSIESSINKLEKNLNNMQPVVSIIGKDLIDKIDKAYEAIRKLDEARAYDLLNSLQNRYREIAKINEYIKEFISLKDKKPFSWIHNDIEDISKKLIEGLNAGNVKIEDIRNTYSNITSINEIIANIEIAIREIIDEPSELQQHLQLILRGFLNMVITQGFITAFNQLIKLQDTLKEIKREMKSLINNINNIRDIGSKILLSISFEQLNNIILDFKSKYKDLISSSFLSYIDENQKLLDRIRLFNEKTKGYYIEINNLKMFLDNLDEDVAGQLVRYINDSMKMVSSTEETPKEFFIMPTNVLDNELKDFINKVDKSIKYIKEQKKALKSKFSKTIIETILKEVLEGICTLREEIVTNLSVASKIINMLVSRKRTYALDEIISLLEDNGLDINEITLAKDPLEKVYEVSKLESIEYIISFNPKLVVSSFAISNNIEDGIRLARLAYIFGRKLDTSLVIDVLNSIKPSDIYEAALLLLKAAGRSVFKDKEEYAAAHAMLLKIFEDYPVDNVTCKDVNSSTLLSKYLKDLYDALCIKNDIPQAIAIVALWCSEEDIRSSKALGLLGGYHVKKLKGIIEELSKILDTKFEDDELAAISYVVDIFWSNRPSMVHDELNASLNLINDHRILDLLREYRRYIRKESALEVIKIVKDVYEMIKNKDYCRKILQKYLDIEIMGELSAETRSELLLRLINNTDFPVEINKVELKIKHNTYIITERTIKLESNRYQDFEFILPKMYIDEYDLVRGRELNGSVQFYVRIPGLLDNKYLTVGPKEIPIPVKYYGPKGVLMSYFEKLRKGLTDVMLPSSLKEALIGAGGNNIVLLGISKEDGRRVVVKIPGFVVDIGVIPTQTHPMMSECEDYARRCIDATNRCSGKVARIRNIVFSPLIYAVEEYIDGETLRKKLNEVKQLNKEEALRIAINVGEALKCLHNSHVYHNDIRPENIIISKENVILIDVGIDEVWNLLRYGSHIKGETHVGARVDEAYTHPLLLEKLKKENLTDEDKAKLDLFQLGLLLYEMLLGYNPINTLKVGNLKLLPPALEELEKILIKICSPHSLPELTLNEFIEKLKTLLQN
jgi:hypothetical protein